MTQGQKLILGLLALANVLVIGGMITYVLSQRHREAAGAPPETPAAAGAVAGSLIPTASPCVDFLIESLLWTGGGARASALEKAIVVEVAFDQRRRAQPDGPEAAPQLLWALLDSLSPAFTQVCGTPEQVTLSARFEGTAPPQFFTVQLAGEHLVAWLQGRLDDDALASEARYRQSASTGDALSAPLP